MDLSTEARRDAAAEEAIPRRNEEMRNDFRRIMNVSRG
jgi:hypothetical protein